MRQEPRRRENGRERASRRERETNGIRDRRDEATTDAAADLYGTRGQDTAYAPHDTGPHTAPPAREHPAEDDNWWLANVYGDTRAPQSSDDSDVYDAQHFGASQAAPGSPGNGVYDTGAYSASHAGNRDEHSSPYDAGAYGGSRVARPPDGDDGAYGAARQEEARRERLERLAQRRRSQGGTTGASRTIEGGRGRSGMALCIGAVLVMAAVSAGAITLWVRVADTGSTSGGNDEAAARPLRSSGAEGTATPAGIADGLGHVFVAGDSLTATATYMYGPGEGAPADVEFMAWQGWTAAEALPALETAVAEGRADTVVVALGTNDSADVLGADGWSAADVERFRELLATPQDTACVVVVLPGYGTGIDPKHGAEIDQARADLQRLSEERQQRRVADPSHGATVVVDWHAEVTARPEIISPDGIHLAQDPATGFISTQAATARTALYWDGVAACTDQ